MKYLVAFALLWSQLALADRCIAPDGTTYDCFGDGRASSPSLTVGNQRTGLFSSGNGDLRFAVLGVEVGRFDLKDGWVVSSTTSRQVGAFGLSITDDAETPSSWAINSTSKANSQITGGLNATPIGQTTPAAGSFTSGTFITSEVKTLNAGKIQLNGNLLASAAEPTIVSGFGDAPRVNHSNGTASFTVLVSPTGGSSRGVIGMPKAKNGWACSAADVSAPDRSMTQQTGSSPSSVTLTNYIRTTGVPGNWSQNDLIEVTCFPN